MDENPQHPDLSTIDRARTLNWSSLKDFLVVAETGSLTAAARRLGVSQPTLTRRIAALEDSLHAELFRRSSRGLELTEVGEAALEPARRMEQGAQALELAVSARDAVPAGLVRVTATDGLAVEWLTPTLAEFRTRQPGIDFEIITRLTAMDLMRREADIAIRLGRPTEPELVARRVGDLEFGLFASRAYLERCGMPDTPADLVQHFGVSFDQVDVYSGTGSFLDKKLAPARIVYRANTISAQLAAIRAGFGSPSARPASPRGRPSLARDRAGRKRPSRRGRWRGRSPRSRRRGRSGHAARSPDRQNARGRSRRARSRACSL